MMMDLTKNQKKIQADNKKKMLDTLSDTQKNKMKKTMMGDYK